MSPEERAVLIAEIAEAVSVAHKKELTDEELTWVRLAISAEARKIKFRDAVIEKSLSGLVWAGLVGFGYIFLDFLKNHGLKLS
jgi:hypothetical protein